MNVIEKIIAVHAGLKTVNKNTKKSLKTNGFHSSLCLERSERNGNNYENTSQRQVNFRRHQEAI